MQTYKTNWEISDFLFEWKVIIGSKCRLKSKRISGELSIYTSKVWSIRYILPYPFDLLNLIFSNQILKPLDRKQALFDTLVVLDFVSSKEIQK